MKNNINLKLTDLSEKLRKYEEMWVALSLDHKRVLGVGKTLKEAKERAKKRSKEYIFIKLPSFKVSYIPLCAYEVSLFENTARRPNKEMD